MHALQQFIQDFMDAQQPKAWTQADLSRASGLTPQHISRLMSGPTPMRSMIEPPTVAALARCLHVTENFIRLKAAEAMGVDVGDLKLVRELESVTDEELLGEVRRRMTRAGDQHGTPIAQPGQLIEEAQLEDGARRFRTGHTRQRAADRLATEPPLDLRGTPSGRDKPGKSGQKA